MFSTLGGVKYIGGGGIMSTTGGYFILTRMDLDSWNCITDGYFFGILASSVSLLAIENDFHHSDNILQQIKFLHASLKEELAFPKG